LATVIGLLCLLLVWPKDENFFEIKKLVSIALFLEAGYFVSLLPSVWFMLRPERITYSLTLSVSFLLQILLVAPSLTILAFNILKMKDTEKPKSVFVCLAFVNYVAALLLNSMFRWFDMISNEGIMFLLSGIRALGFLNAVIVMSLALIFSIVTYYNLFKNKKALAYRWCGLTLTLIGLHYIIFLFYSYVVGALDYVWLVDIWTIPLFGLGFSILMSSRSFNEHQ
jgi:hypothetical protein